MKIAVLAGYFDLFSGYQEVVMARSLARLGHEVTVICSDRCCPIFSYSFLARTGHARSYPVGIQEAEGLRIHRLRAVFEQRCMVWCRGVLGRLTAVAPDYVIHFVGGQLLPVAGVFYGRAGLRRAAVYGDNSAQWVGHARLTRVFKRVVFHLSKGYIYLAQNARADQVFCNTADTIRRLRLLHFWHRPALLPLSFDGAIFYHSEELRRQYRARLGLPEGHLLLASSGKMIPEKRFEDLLTVFGGLLARLPQLRLLLIGASPTPYCQMMRRRVQQDVALSRTVKILDFEPAPEINGYLNAADVGVWHRQPAVSIQQGMGTGLFVVLPRNEFVGHLLRDDAGEYFADGSTAGLAESLERAARHVAGEPQEARQRRRQTNEWLSNLEVARMLVAPALR